MFQESDEQQTLMRAEFILGEKGKKLQESWAQLWREHILPVIDEEPFRQFFAETDGRPNKSVRQVISLLLLKHLFDMTDEEVCAEFRWNLQWHHALEADPAEADIVRKTLYNYRQMLLEIDGAEALFDRVTDRLIEVGGIDVSLQRTDSTQIVSDIQKLSRLGVFVETLEVVLEEMEATTPELFEEIGPELIERYVERPSGAFADASRSELPRRLQTCAEDVYWLVERFDQREETAQLEHWSTLCRLLEERCEVVEGETSTHQGPGTSVEICGSDEQADGQTSGQPKSGPDNADPPIEGAEPDGQDAGGEGAEPPDSEPEAAGERMEANVEPKSAGDIKGASLQTPHDPDATHGHKGTGYSVQLTQTYHPDNLFQLIVDVRTTPACGNDTNETEPTLKRLKAAGRAPDVLLADAQYISATNVSGAAGMGTWLIGPMNGPTLKEDRIYLKDFELGEERAGHAVVRCPSGAESVSEELSTGKGAAESDTRLSRFPKSACTDCERRAVCPVMRQRVREAEQADRPLNLTVDPFVRSDAKNRLVARYRQLLADDGIREEYAMRAGIEPLNSRLKQGHRFDRPRARGQEAIEQRVTLKATAYNIKRAFRATLAATKGGHTHLFGAFIALLTFIGRHISRQCCETDTTSRRISRPNRPWSGKTPAHEPPRLVVST